MDKGEPNSVRRNRGHLVESSFFMNTIETGSCQDRYRAFGKAGFRVELCSKYEHGHGSDQSARKGDQVGGNRPGKNRDVQDRA